MFWLSLVQFVLILILPYKYRTTFVNLYCLKINSMATINFLFRSTKAEANLTLRLLFRHQGADYVVGASTRLSVTKYYWEKQHNVKKPKDIDVMNLQHEVTEALNKIEKHVLTAFNLANPDAVDKKWLQSQVELYYNPPVEPKQLPTDLVGYIDKYFEFKKGDITPNTKKKINVVKQLLMRYIDAMGKGLKLTDVDLNFKLSFEKYCAEQLYATNTVSTALKFIKTICNHAQSVGLNVSPQLGKIKIKQHEVESVFLTFEELDKIENVDDNEFTDSLLNARDWLIISCYTGQRISDFMKFTHKSIRVEQGKSLLEFTQVKTKKKMTIAVHPKVLEMLKKRGGHFPKAISDQKYNGYIKKVCEIAGIDEVVNGSKKSETAENSKVFRKEEGSFPKWQLVTSHIGRRSFASNFYGIIPTSYLTYATGHSTETMFLAYIGKSNKDLALEMTKYFE